MQQPLSIDAKSQELIKLVYVACRQFPKSEKFVLAAEIRQSSIKIQRLIITALKRYHKKTTLSDLDIEIAVLYRQIRLAHSLKYIDSKKYEAISVTLSEIGKMVGGWIKANSNKGKAL